MQTIAGSIQSASVNPGTTRRIDLCIIVLVQNLTAAERKSHAAMMKLKRLQQWTVVGVRIFFGHSSVELRRLPAYKLQVH